MVRRTHVDVLHNHEVFVSVMRIRDGCVRATFSQRVRLRAGFGYFRLGSLSEVSRSGDGDWFGDGGGSRTQGGEFTKHV